MLLFSHSARFIATERHVLQAHEIPRRVRPLPVAFAPYVSQDAIVRFHMEDLATDHFRWRYCSDGFISVDVCVITELLVPCFLNSACAIHIANDMAWKIKYQTYVPHTTGPLQHYAVINTQHNSLSNSLKNRIRAFGALVRDGRRSYGPTY